MKRLMIVVAAMIALLIGGTALALSDPYEIEPPVPKGYDLPYTLTVYLNNQMVVAYDAATLEPVRHMVCSSGAASTPTITGTFYIPRTPAQSWSTFGNVYVRFPTRIKSGYYFHSILYGRTSPDSLNMVSWRDFGKRASHGCVRLLPVDAQWINYNCAKGTRVRIVRKKDFDLKDIHDEMLKEIRKNGHMAYQPTLKPTPTPIPPTLSLGSTGVNVKSLQNRLRQRGFYPGALSAKFDQATETAWNEYQTQRGWAADGVATPEEQTDLYELEDVLAYNCTLTKGFTGPIVKAVETRLLALGFLAGAPGKTYNSRTIAAVKQFQQAANLPIGAAFTPQMQALLFSVTAPTPTPAPDLALGSKGTRVVQLQKRLYSLGFYAGQSTGKFQAATVGAVNAYLAAVGETETGTVTHAQFIRIMNEDTTVGTARRLASGSKGVVVRVIEEKLKQLGHFGAEPNLNYDLVTVAAVKQFQKANGMTPTGVCIRDVTLAILNA